MTVNYSVNRGQNSPFASCAEQCNSSQYSAESEVEAKNFILYVGHLGCREPVVQPATSEKGEVSVEGKDCAATCCSGAHSACGGIGDCSACRGGAQEERRPRR